LHPATRQRFFTLNFGFYSVQELTEIARRRAKAMGVEYEAGVLDELAKWASPRMVGAPKGLSFGSPRTFRG
jgi:Holliday junction resolvasome RuvABC ATP-dependent DNA helicase subunit